jgi:hypothetical protein
MNEEFPVSASHKLALITSLPFVHTARRYYRLDDLVRPSDWLLVGSNLLADREDVQTVSSRGSKSRNKVFVGEPAEGSLPYTTYASDGKKESFAGFHLTLETASWIHTLSGWSHEMGFVSFETPLQHVAFHAYLCVA